MLFVLFFRIALFAMFADIAPAAIPLSMLTTDNPNEQLCNIDARVLNSFPSITISNRCGNPNYWDINH